MNKHDEGYTLPLVMVVLLVLAIVAVTIMTTSMNNMLRQQALIDQTKAQYEAQGEIEKIVAQLENLGTEPVKIELEDLTPTGNTITGKITAQGEEGDSKITIKCEIVLTAEKIEKEKKDGTETENYIITGTPKVTYTSYEIIKGGGS